MVLEDDFEVHLVDAQTLIPFKEHYDNQNGKHYVEVEPKAEYLLSYQRVRTDRKEDFLLYATVDGKRLGWQKNYAGVPESDNKACTDGVWHDNEKGLTEVYPLKFVPVEHDNKKEEAKNPPTAATSTMPVVRGIVEFRLYTAHLTRQKDAEELPEKYSCGNQSDESSIESTIDSGEKITCTEKSKIVQSEPSTTIVVTKKTSFVRYYPGKRLATITLHYCTVPGLIDVGILPKPSNIYEHYKIIHRKQNIKIPPAAVAPQQKCVTLTETIDGENQVIKNIYYDLFDLTTLEDDDDSDIEILDSNVNSKSKNDDDENNDSLIEQDKEEDECSSSTNLDDPYVVVETHRINKKFRISFTVS